MKKHSAKRFVLAPKSRIALSRAPIESPTSPRTRISNYGQLLRPLSTQLLRASIALGTKDIAAIRIEAARAYYVLGEVFEQGDQMVTQTHLQQVHQAITELFDQQVSVRSIRNAQELLRHFLLSFESTQPSALSSVEMRDLGISATDNLTIEEILVVRVAFGIRRACLALLACQPELAFAYLEMLGRDAQELHRCQPELMSTDLWLQYLNVHRKLKNNQITQANARCFGSTLKRSILPLLNHAKVLLKQHSSLSTAVH